MTIDPLWSTLVEVKDAASSIHTLRCWEGQISQALKRTILKQSTVRFSFIVIDVPTICKRLSLNLTLRRQKHIREAYRKCVSLWSRKLQLAHPIFHQFFIFHSIVPVTVYNLLKFPTFASQSKPQHVGRPNPTNQWIRGKKQHLLFSAQWDSSDKKKQPMTQGRTRTVQRRVKKGVRRTSWQCFSVSDWSFLEGLWSLKQGVSTIESTSSRDKTISDCHCGKANQKEDPTLSIKFPSIAGFLEQYSKNTPGQSERLRSHCSPIVLKSKLSDIRFLRVFVPALQCNDKKKVTCWLWNRC